MTHPRHVDPTREPPEADSKDERKWNTRELEVLAMISTLEYFRPYIDGQVIHVDTDHRPTRYSSHWGQVPGHFSYAGTV